ncbi:MAG: signal peptidase II [Eubacteriaceae bacterium]|nr:signal peptidase II [Eubacteriaceae bacterium]MBR5996129.1 signal peptidase II [Eubacteriaceae bacterium]
MWFILITAIMLADLVTKFAAFRLLRNKVGLTLIKGVIDLEYVENTGAAFGILQGKSYYLGIFSLAVSFALILFMLIEKKRNPGKRFFSYTLAMIIGGALANGIERVYHNYVTDFLKFAFIDFPVFNVADSFITVGGILLCLILIFDRQIEL